MNDLMMTRILAVAVLGTLSLASEEKMPPTDPGIYRDCSEIQAQTKRPSGIYQVQPEGSSSFNVYCDFNVDGGGWTVIQRRMDGSVSFQKRWSDYKIGFGFLNTEFWLGNEKMAYLTAQKNYELRIELQNKYGNRYYAKYDHFRVGDAGGYYLLLLGEYSGNSGETPLGYCTANTKEGGTTTPMENSITCEAQLGSDAKESRTIGGDALNRFHRNSRFSTIDADHDDTDSQNCADIHGGGWWFGACDDANLNGLYGVNDNKGIEWNGLPEGPYELQFTEMKIRPKRI